MPSLSFLLTCVAQISAVKSLEGLIRYRRNISVLVGRVCVHAYVMNILSTALIQVFDYIAACECRKLVSVSKEASSEPIILYYGPSSYIECNIADDVPGYSVELSVSIPTNGEAVPLSGKCYRNCHEIAGTGEQF